MPRILILTRDKSYGRFLENLVAQLGPEFESSVRDPCEPDSQGWNPDMVILDRDDSFEDIRKKFGQDGNIPFMLLSNTRAPESGADCFQVLTKPLNAGHFVQSLYEYFGNALSLIDMKDCDFRTIENYLIGSSAIMNEVRSSILKLSTTALPVFIHGETGTGKGVVARSLHAFSYRKQEPYIEINCANLPSSLLESELFGYKQGAFTGAYNDKIGKFQLAGNGTVFLDEISEMSPYMQAKLLQVLQDGEFFPVGSNENVMVDVRILAATNAEPKKMVSHAILRKDLYYRLAVISIYLPPLRKRREDIEILTSYFLEKYCGLYRKKSFNFPEKLKKIFEMYEWPGNIRELESVVKTLVVLENDEEIREDLQNKLSKSNQSQASSETSYWKQDYRRFGLKGITANAVAETEKDLIARAVAETGGNKKQAAELLRISYKSLLNKIKDYGL